MKTAVVSCDNYERSTVEAALEEGLAYVGGIEQYIRPGMRVLIKPNLVIAKKPETCATTHPSVVAAVARKVKAAGAEPIIGDSAGGPFNEAWMKHVYASSGMLDVERETGVPLNRDYSTVDRFNEKAELLKKVTLWKTLAEADAVITVGKLKSHGLTGYCGAVKNLFGSIPGTLKIEYHYRMEGLQEFSKMLVELCEYVNPVLSIIDGVWGMEGEGPTGGDPKKIGQLVVSDSPHAADVAGCALIGLKPEEMCTIKRAVEKGLITGRLEDIGLNRPIEDLVVKDFKTLPIRDNRMLNRNMPKFVEVFLGPFFRPKPIFLHDKCVGCGICKNSCPAKAIVMREGRPYADMEKCIRCFCCQELCPKVAVKVKRPLFSRILK